VAVGDLNGDGIPDVALTDNVGVKVLLHTGAAGAATYAAPVSVFTQTVNANLTGANLIAIADVNGDGLNDLVITDPGTFNAAVNYAVQFANEIAVADVNGDGYLDIVVGTGRSHPIENGVTTNNPGVLLQNTCSPGTFGSLQALP
jgi:hypothetical protein